ncbi:hypothetical protein ACQRIU_006504 [Beauveria bassiana]
MSSAPKSILHLHFRPRRPLPEIILTVIPDSRVQDGTVKAANANHDDASLDRETQPVVVQLTRVAAAAAAAAASSTQAAGDFSSYLALQSPLFVHLERDFGGSYSRHASVAESDSDKHGAEDDSGRVYKYQKNAQAIAQAVGQYADDDERACASRVDTTAATPV